ncbi:serine/threonine-protein kinase [Pleurocapsa sp. PCC 7319]|uniref:serine/threonine protein kinase n=1 Tax=Pleurocapsa sp. PCC 7319 TaxID=118161 RepID=UPI00034B6582|nr:serine/threonine-protein kinase [Pleurocapsa sp. PCC 7319]
METLHQQAEIIVNRYQIVTTLGQGGMGTTYAAVDLQSSQRVAIKVVSLRQVQDWKILELFEREAKVLANLNHPYIPDYLDYFELDTNEDKRFYLVQELVEGKSVAESFEQGWQATENEARNIAAQVLLILGYLHSLIPPVIHRDIKPQNIIRREDGKVYLVDFGAVQDVYRNTVSVSNTFVGSLGYMSLEQLRGNVVPASDLYSLGCSLIFLITGKSPTDLPEKRMKINFRSQANVSDDFADWLDRLIEPSLERRFPSAEDALSQLRKSPKIPVVNSQPIIQKLPNSSIVIKKENQKLHITILGTVDDLVFGFAQFLVVGLGLSFIALGFLGSGNLGLGLIFSIGLVALYVAILNTYYGIVKKTSLAIYPTSFQLDWTTWSWTGAKNKSVSGFTQDIDSVYLYLDLHKTKTTNGRIEKTIVSSCAISVGKQEYEFGNGYQLTEAEANCLVQEISAFLKHVRG